MSLLGWLLGERPVPPPPPTMNGKMKRLDAAVAALEATAKDLTDDPSALLRALVHRSRNDEHIRYAEDE